MNIEEKIKQQYEEGVANVHRVYDIFKDFFGEEKVDLQNVPSLETIKTHLKEDSIESYILVSDISPLRDKWTHIYEKNFYQLEKEDQEIILNDINICSEIEYRMDDSIGVNSHSYILVWFPEVRITNEHDRYVDIQDLYAKVLVDFEGRMPHRFSLNRATYSMLHMKNSYMHSHVNHIPTGDFTVFQVPCTGSGPINRTMDSLEEYNEEYIWNMFCLELSKYVTVESLEGVPYHRLESLGTADMKMINTNNFEIIKGLPRAWTILHNADGTLTTKRLFKEFMLYVINSNKITYGFSENGYTLGMSVFDFSITLSNLFIEWYNKKYNEYVNTPNALPTYDDLLEEQTMLLVKISNKRIYSEYSINTAARYKDYIGKLMCNFKGKEIRISIPDQEALPKDYSCILNPQITSFFAWRLMEIINFEYGNRNSEYASGDKALEGRRYL